MGIINPELNILDIFEDVEYVRDSVEVSLVEGTSRRARCQTSRGCIRIAVRFSARMVWKQWTENDVISLIDPAIAHQGFEAEISKCIHVGLLCVQEYAQDRPDISDVIAKLNASNTASFQEPKSPGFTRFMHDTSSTRTQRNQTSSMNGLSITNISGR